MFIFCCNCDKSVDLFYPLVEHIPYAYKWAAVPGVSELAEFRLGSVVNRDDFISDVYTYVHLNADNIQGVVLTNDWCLEARALIVICRLYKVTTFVLQESIIALNTAECRLLNADVAFVQGQATMHAIENCHDQIFITGHTIYNNLYIDLDQSKRDRIIINVNFTSIDNETKSKKWLDDVLDQMDGYNCVLMVHPRCTMDLDTYRCEVVHSDSSKVSTIFAGGGVLISRESSLIHEAMFKGFRVIMYGGDFEAMPYKFGKKNNLLKIARLKNDILRQFRSIQDVEFSLDDIKCYLGEHYELVDTVAADISELLNKKYTKEKLRFSDSCVITKLFFHKFKRILKLWL